MTTGGRSGRSGRCPGRATEDAERLVADLPAVAVRAVQHVAGPPLAQARNVGQLVAQAGGDQQPPRRDRVAVGEQDLEPVVAARGRRSADGAGDDGRRRSRCTSSRPGRQQVGGRQPVAGQEPVHVRGGRVARCAGVHHEDPAAGAGQDQGCGQAGGSAADDHDVVCVHARQAVRRTGPAGNERCCFRESGVEWARWRTRRPAIAAALDQVGPRLKQLRAAAWGDPDRAGGGDRHLQEHAVAAGDRAAPRRAWSCCCRWRRPTGCRWTTSSARPRSATRASGSSHARSTAARSCR